MFYIPQRVSTKDKKRVKPSALEDEDQAAQSEWIDVDEMPRRKTRTTKQSNRVGPFSSTAAGAYYRKKDHNSEVDPTGFLPRLNRIPENEKLGNPKHRGKRLPIYDTDPIGADRPGHHITNQHYVHGSKERILKQAYNNPSLLSVLSSSTNATQRSSGSDSTVTQRSYEKAILEKRAKTVGSPSTSPATKPLDAEEIPSSTDTSKYPNVFDFLCNQSTRKDSVVASSATSDTVLPSHFTSSEHDSSSLVETSSSSSSVSSPSSSSPTSTRNKGHATIHSDAELHMSDNWPKEGVSHDRLHPSDDDHGANVEYEIEEARMRTHQRQWSEYDQRAVLERQEQFRQEHIAATEALRRQSTAEPQTNPDQLPQDTSYYHQYSYPPPKAIEEASALPERSIHTSAQNHEAHATMPMAPEAPDLSKTTLAGYELIAVKLTEAAPVIRPLYRKFEQLEHRVLLHLQDEISVLEERLRPLDEVLTQWSRADEETADKPSSRRQDLWHGTELHHRRTLLLGEIYLKLEQYRKSLLPYLLSKRSFGMNRDMR